MTAIHYKYLYGYKNILFKKNNHRIDNYVKIYNTYNTNTYVCTYMKGA